MGVYRGLILNYRNGFMIPLKFRIIILHWQFSVNISNVSMMARYFARGGGSRFTYFNCRAWVTMGDSFIYFTCLQALEYYEARFRFADRVYGSTFFIATGF